MFGSSILLHFHICIFLYIGSWQEVAVMVMLGLDYFRIVIVGAVKFFGVEIKKCRKEARVLARSQITT